MLILVLKVLYNDKLDYLKQSWVKVKDLLFDLGLSKRKHQVRERFKHYLDPNIDI